jgi:hypothetical protein
MNAASPSDRRRRRGALRARRAVAALAVFLVFLVMGCATKAQGTFSKSDLAIASAAKTHRFRVELAVTPNQRAQGLMWRRHVDAASGMLFLYPQDMVIRMWMKNTLVPLDMLFIDREGRVVSVKERAVPQSLAVISSGQRARAVLELAGGTVSRLGLKRGDRILHPAFGTR